MRYIKKVILENFQSHKYTVVELGPELNVIVGPSDTGKSAIIRGIKWALYNEPSGDYFIREGERDCSVTIEFSDNLKIKRYRSKSKNMYILYDKEGEEIRFEGFGTVVPEEIIEQVGIKKIYLDSDETTSVNLGEQLEGAFLLSEKTGVRASAIGRLVGVNIIDDALRETLKDTRNLSNSKKNLEETINNLENELKEYDYIEELVNKINKIDEIKNGILDRSKRKEKLVSILNEVTSLKSELKTLKYQLVILEKVDKLEIITKTISEEFSKYRYLNNQKSSLDRITNGIKEDLNTLEELREMNPVVNIFNMLPDLINKTKHLEELLTKTSVLKRENKRVENICNSLSEIDNVENNTISIVNKYSILSKLESINSKLNLTRDSIQKGSQYIDNFKDVERSYELSREILNKKDILQKLYDNHKKYQSILKEKNNEINSLENLVIDTNKEKERYEVLLSKQEVCPFCLSAIDENKIKHIMDHYN